MKSRKLVPWLALGVVVVVAVVVLVVRSRPDNSPAARVDRLEHQLACPVCEGQSVFDSNSPQSQAIRDDIPRRIAAGQSDAEIRAYYVSRYTEKILETPSNSGLGIVAWGLPALAVILGAAGIVVAVRRWSHTPRLHATDEDEDIVRREREAELERDDDGDDRRRRRAERGRAHERRRRGARSRARVPAALARRSRQRAARGQHRPRHLPRAARRLHRPRVGRHPVDRRRRGATAPTAAPRPARRCGCSRSAASSCSRCSPRSCSRTRSASGSPDGEITGDAQAGRYADHRVGRNRAAAKAAAVAQPKSYDARSPTPARCCRPATTRTRSSSSSRPSKLDPTQAEPLAYAGWLTVLVAASR